MGGEYQRTINVPDIIAICVNAGLGSLIEFQTVYSIEDVYDLLEILTVRENNRRRAQKDANN